MAQAIKEKDFVKAMSLRDPEFQESLEGFNATASLDTSQRLPKAKVSVWYFQTTFFKTIFVG